MHASLCNKPLLSNRGLLGRRKCERKSVRYLFGSCSIGTGTESLWVLVRPVLPMQKLASTPCPEHARNEKQLRKQRGRGGQRRCSETSQKLISLDFSTPYIKDSEGPEVHKLRGPTWKPWSGLFSRHLCYAPVPALFTKKYELWT